MYELDWTKQLGAAFSDDQAGVLASMQRLRAQAVQYGNLKSSRAAEVETQTDNGKQVIVIQPANPQVVYVPQYNPQTVYVASPGPSTGDVVAASVISFGVGMAVGAMFSNNNYYPIRAGVMAGFTTAAVPTIRPIILIGQFMARRFAQPMATGPGQLSLSPANYNNNYYNNYRGGNNNTTTTSLSWRKQHGQR